MTKTLIILCLLVLGSAQAQLGGKYAFSFLDLPFNARSLALGTDFISARDQDLNLSISNPSLLNKEQMNRISFNQAFFPAGTNLGMINYAREFKKELMLGGALRYVNYGEIARTDAIGNEIGTFQPMDWDLTLLTSRPMAPNFFLGLGTHFIFSQIDQYKSVGMSLDFSGSYVREEKGFVATALVKNAGYQFTAYNEKNRSPLPVEIQAAVSKKLAHAPFRFSILGHHLNKWDLSYQDPNAKPTIDVLTGDTIPVKQENFASKLFRHATFQTELLIGKNIHLRTAFDYHKRQEMKLFDRPGASGLSFGLGLWFKKFSLDYGFGIVSKAGYQHMISLQTDFSKWRK